VRTSCLHQVLGGGQHHTCIIRSTLAGQGICLAHSDCSFMIFLDVCNLLFEMHLILYHALWIGLGKAWRLYWLCYGCNLPHLCPEFTMHSHQSTPSWQLGLSKFCRDCIQAQAGSPLVVLKVADGQKNFGPQHDFCTFSDEPSWPPLESRRNHCYWGILLVLVLACKHSPVIVIVFHNFSARWANCHRDNTHGTSKSQLTCCK
jgi:hypothetical protein